MWVKFWAVANCASRASVPGPGDVTHVDWFDEEPTEEILKEYAEEYAPDWMRHSERGFKYGYETYKDLPEDLRAKEVEKHLRIKRGAEARLKRLGA